MFYWLFFKMNELDVDVDWVDTLPLLPTPAIIYCVGVYGLLGTDPGLCCCPTFNDDGYCDDNEDGVYFEICKGAFFMSKFVKPE
jgi:hypothetical protein